MNIFKLFIPQLLSYPNPTDPLNGEAAALLMRDPEAYAGRIRDCVRLYASDPVHLDGTPVLGASSNTNDANANSDTASASSSSSSDGGGSSSGSAGSGSAGSGRASAGGSAIGSGSSGGRSNSIGSDTSGISASSSGLSGSSFESESLSSSEEDKAPVTMTVAVGDGANGNRGGSLGGSANNRCENGNEERGDNDATMEEVDDKEGDVKRRKSTTNKGGNSCRGSDMMEVRKTGVFLFFL